jgi:hypothetical protein
MADPSISATPDGKANVRSGLGGILFCDNLFMSAVAAVMDFRNGLGTYLGLSGVGVAKADATTWVLVNGTADSTQEAQIRKKFADNYAAYTTTPLSGETVTDALATWEKIRKQILDFLNASFCGLAFHEFEAEDTRATRLGRVRSHSIWFAGNTDIYLDSWDLVHSHPSDPDVSKSHDGFWIMIHELSHCIFEIADDLGTTSDPGLVEAKLNPLRIGFGLTKRTSYPSPINFANGGSFTIPPRPP